MGPPEEDRPPRAASLPAGYDEADPYGDEVIEDYPEWWRDHVETFREHGMRPYRPPRFADGAVTTAVIERLEDELGVGIRLRKPPDGEEWALLVDDDPVVTVGRRRDGDGFTVYDLDSEQVEALVREASD